MELDIWKSTVCWQLASHILRLDTSIMTHLICSQKWLYIWHIMHAVPADKPSKWDIFCCIQTRNNTYVVIFMEGKKNKKQHILFWLPWRLSGGEGEMPSWSSNPHLLPLCTPLLPISVTEADTSGGPDGVCYTCFAVVRLLFIRHRGRGSSGGSGPDRRKLLFRSLKRREEGEEERNELGEKNKCPY